MASSVTTSSNVVRLSFFNSSPLGIGLRDGLYSNLGFTIHCLLQRERTWFFTSLTSCALLLCVDGCFGMKN